MRGETETELSRYGFKDPVVLVWECVALVWSDFSISEDGSNHLVLQPAAECVSPRPDDLSPSWIEPYRMMALSSLTMAKDLSAQLDVFDKTLVILSQRNADPDGSNAKALLVDISNLSAQVVSNTAKSRHCFSAAQAYVQLLFERLGELRESHVGDCQRRDVFIELRFKPSVSYCSSTEQRLEFLAERVANLGDLLQAWVQVKMEEQNSEILKSLNARAAAQIKIQRAVEGCRLLPLPTTCLICSNGAIRACTCTCTCSASKWPRAR